MLGTLSALTSYYYLADKGGIPGIIKGASLGSGGLAFDEGLNTYTYVCNSRVAGNRIKFGYGAEQRMYAREECWEFCVKRERITIVNEVIKSPPKVFPLILTRPEDTKCPVCFDDLSGNVVECASKHQVCLQCFNLLPRPAGTCKCPICRDGYYLDELHKVKLMNGEIVQKKDPYFYLDLRGYNSSNDFAINEALFMNAIKREALWGRPNRLHTMILSSFYNYYMNHNDRFTYGFNVLHQIDYNNRYLKPHHEEELPRAFLFYIELIKLPVIYNDVAHTEIYTSYYEDRDFYRDLEMIDGNINRLKDYPGTNNKAILQREIYFRSKIQNLSNEELQKLIKEIFINILQEAHHQKDRYNIITREVNE